MNRIKIAVVTITLAAVSLCVSGCATLEPRFRAEIEKDASPGDAVHFFSADEKADREGFRPGETVTVYRPAGDYYGYVQNNNVVGKVKVTDMSGEHYREAVVVEGTVKNGDFAVPNDKAGK